MSRQSRRNRKKDEFEQKLIDLARVTRVVAGGRRFRFRACVACGNKKGKVGIGVSKGQDVSTAMSKAFRKAKKNSVNVSLSNGTIPHDIFEKFGSARVFMKPARRGTGIIAGGPIRAVLELAGVKDIYSKIYGTNNKISNAKAAWNALREMQLTEEILKRRGKERERRIKDKSTSSLLQQEKSGA